MGTQQLLLCYSPYPGMGLEEIIIGVHDASLNAETVHIFSSKQQARKLFHEEFDLQCEKVKECLDDIEQGSTPETSTRLPIVINGSAALKIISAIDFLNQFQTPDEEVATSGDEDKEGEETVFQVACTTDYLYFLDGQGILYLHTDEGEPIFWIFSSKADAFEVLSKASVHLGREDIVSCERNIQFSQLPVLDTTSAIQVPKSSAAIIGPAFLLYTNAQASASLSQ